MAKSRVESLDWLRGLMAFSIMIYHLTGWSFSQPGASTLLGKLGIYGVSIFFILSGLSMAIVYHASLGSIKACAGFFVKRVFRIWPLLWLAVIVAVVGGIVLGKVPDWRLVLMNLTTAFGFFSPGSYINTGAWSIGNEMVYYLLTPIFIYSYKKKILLGNGIAAITVAIGLLFSEILLSPVRPLGEQWSIYINPFNNLFLYVLGIGIYFNTRNIAIEKGWLILIGLTGLALLILYPAQEDQISIVTGFNRIVFCVASLLVVIFFYKNSFFVPRGIEVWLSRLGIITYGVYLLHPLVWEALKIFSDVVSFLKNPYLGIPITIVATIVAATVSYKYLELPFIRLGKKLSASLRDQAYPQPNLVSIKLPE